MFIERAEREELNQLSKEVFGTSSRWQKILKDGYSEIVTRTVKEEIPGVDGAEATFQEITVPVLTESGGKQWKMKYHTVESLKVLMLDFKAKKDAFLAAHKQKQDEDNAKKAQTDLEKKVQSELGGSAL